MAQPRTRQQFIDYCKRRLGEPVIEINVDDDQVEDRVDEAIEYWQQYHNEGQWRSYFPVKIDQTILDVGYVTFGPSNNVIEVIRVLPIRSGSTTRNFFDFKYQFMLNDFAQMTTLLGDLAYYDQLMQYISTLDMQLSGTPQIEYVRHQDRIYWYGDIADGDLRVDDYIIIEAIIRVDPGDDSKAWTNEWLKRYATALIKYQWGSNLIKFEGMQLPSGVVLNGRQILDDANAEIEKLQEEIRMNHELPPDFFVG